MDALPQKIAVAGCLQSSNLQELKLFFDRYTKDIRNGWELTPRYRIEVQTLMISAIRQTGRKMNFRSSAQFTRNYI